MPWVEVACENPECQNVFKPDAEQDEARCPSCGQTHHGPWDDPDDTTDGADAASTSTSTVEAPGGSTVRITIEIIPTETND